METIQIKTGEGQMQAQVARPAAGRADKGIIVIQEAFGITDHLKHVVERFAAEGYVAVAPEMFHRTAPAGKVFETSDYASGVLKPHFEAITNEGLIADVGSARDWLIAQGVPENKIAIIGFCLGGRTAFLAASAKEFNRPLAAAVAFYGGGISDALDRIPAIQAPIYFFWGGKDQSIPEEKRQSVIEAMQASGKEFECKVFPEAGHAFMRDIDPSHYHEASAEEAWALVDAFLAKHLL